MLIWWFHPPEYSLKIQHFLWLILHSVLTIFYKIQLQNVIKNYLFETQNIIFNILFTIWFIAYKILANKSKKDEESEVLWHNLDEKKLKIFMVFQNSINHEKPILYFFMLLMEKSKNIMLIMCLNLYASTKLNIAEREWSDSKAFKLDVHREEYF